jgi:hypothetical protein
VAAAVVAVVDVFPDDTWRAAPLADVIGVTLGVVFEPVAEEPVLLSIEDIADRLAEASHFVRYEEGGALLLVAPANVDNAYQHAAAYAAAYGDPRDEQRVRGYAAALHGWHRQRTPTGHDT